MKVVVNGNDREAKEPASLRSLVEQLESSAERVVASVNDRMVPAKDWESFALSEGDRIEILTLAAGG